MQKTSSFVYAQAVPRMNKKKRHFTPEFEAKVALTALKEVKTLAELANAFGVYANQISQ